MPHRKDRTGGRGRKSRHDDPAAHSTAYRARFQRLVSNISASLISLAPHEIEGWMNSVLELIGAFEGVDRSYVFLFSESGATMDNTHEWCAEGVEPQIDSLKNIPLSTFPWWMMKLKSNEEVNIPLVAKLPPEAAEERKILEAQRIRSLLAVPINVEGRVCGFLGFDSVRLPRRWTKGSVVLIRTIASTLGNALARKRAEEARQKAVDMLRESESRWQFALEGAGDGVWDWDVVKGKVFFSRRWKEMLGYSDEEIGDGLEEWSSRVHPEDLPATLKAIKDHLDGNNRVYTSEHRVRCNDGSYKWILDRGRTVARSEKGLALRVIGTHTDITERKRIEETLRASEADFHAFFETIGDMIFVGDRTGRILYTNSAAVRLLGYTREELLKMRIADLHPAGARTEAESILTSMLRNECSSCSLPLARKDGAALAVETRVWAGKWGSEDCIFGLSKDLSAEQEAKQRFERLFRNNPALMAITTLPDRRFYDCNDSFLKTLGYSREEVTGRTSEELGLFPAPEGMNAMAEKLMADGSVPEMELQVRRRDGKVLRGLFSGEMIRNQGKSFLLTVMVDITERTSAERALKEAVAKLTVLMDNIQSGVLLETPTRKVLFANHKLCEMFSIPVPPETLIGTDCAAAAGQTKELMEDPDAFIKYLDSTLAAGKTAVGNELRLKDGRVLSQDYVPILLENGTFIGHMWKYTDITAAKRLESLKAEVVHHVNHELRRPITNQVLALEYLMDEIGGTLSPDNLKIFTAALSAARSMTRMVSDLLDVTRSETGKLSVRIEPVDLEELARDLLSGLGPSARENGLDLKLDIPPGLPKAAADPARVRQIIGNLTDNAFKFTSSGGSVSVIIRTAAGPGESLEVSVSDTGQGMEKEELGHIFDRLYQASSISRKGMKGLGLGLHICKTLVEQQGGSITVESEKGRGTTFRFTLPVWKDRQ